ncbi:glycosyltransferase family 2 protein [Paradesertivirga mongoliensis]|uniref:Glycosyltransferase family 2 protein n=1 Tax=Paradesertivirga mongoliensis TaxID=2100740 RepID=A0ABW4ZMX7_9SPHI|nr:glycosyltransferase family 2 protein [Pedobacter mongoliensis]
MSIVKLPGWLNQHLYREKRFSDLTEEELDELKGRLNKIRNDNPDISVVIPAWNEGDGIYRTLSSLASNITNLKVELIVVNNNSTDHTQAVLDRLGVKSFFQPVQGITFARQMGLMNARGKYHLSADSDTFYPPRWIELMTKPMIAEPDVVGVYGRYGFIPPEGRTRLNLWFYEKVTGVLIRIRRYNREYINVLGFTMGFVTEIGKATGGFEVTDVRKFDNALGSEYFVEESEDGRMAVNLKKKGSLKLVTHRDARVFTSSRRLTSEGGVLTSFIRRLKLHFKQMNEYLIGS